jgi:chromosome segregation ATPase
MTTLEDLRNASHDQETSIWELKNEIRILKEQQLEAHQEFEQLHQVKSRIDKRLNEINGKISAVETEKAHKMEELEFLNSAIQSRESGNVDLVIGIKRAKVDLQKAIQNVKKVLEDIEFAEKQIDASREDQKLKIRLFLAAERLAIPVRRRLDAKNAELSNLANDRVRLNMEKTAAEGEVDRLNRQLQKIEDQNRQQDQILDHYERELRANNAAIDKNVNELERLTTRYRTVQVKQTRTDVNSLEDKVRDLQDKIKTAIEASREKQDGWIKTQSNFLNILKSCEILERENMESNSQLAILQRKRDKTASQLTSLQHENQKYQIHIRVFQKELERLNQQILGRSGTPVNIESGIYDILAAKEKEAAEIARKIDENDRKRNEIAEERLQVEKRIVILEENLKMAEELDKKFDTEGNNKELAVMKKEIHRLESRLSEIRAQTEGLTRQIEQALKKREDVRVTKEKSDELNCQQLKDELIKARLEIDRNEELIKEEQTQQAKLISELHQIQEIAAEYEAQARGFKMMMNDQQRLHGTLMIKLEQLNQQNQWFGSRKLIVKQGLFEHDFNRLKDQGEKLLELIEGWKDEEPDLDHDFLAIQDRLSLLFVE